MSEFMAETKKRDTERRAQALDPAEALSKAQEFVQNNLFELCNEALLLNIGQYHDKDGKFLQLVEILKDITANNAHAVARTLVAERAMRTIAEGI
jgi:hypothetical protein